MLLLPMIVFRVLVVYAVREFVFRVSPVVVMMMSVLILPGDLFVMAFDRARKVVKGICMAMPSGVVSSVYSTNVLVICNQFKSITDIGSNIPRNYYLFQRQYLVDKVLDKLWRRQSRRERKRSTSESRNFTKQKEGIDLAMDL